jgi:hypothetical protein
VDNALAKTAFFRVNWYKDETIISEATYLALSGARRRYWSPVMSQQNTVAGYRRKTLDLNIETNRTCKISYSALSGDDTLAVGDIVERYNGEQLLARGEITYLTEVDLCFVIKHVYEIDPALDSGSFLVRGKDLTFTSIGMTELSSDIPADESEYWELISCYEYEQEINEARRLVRVINKGYTSQLTRDMSTIFRS